jgi:hypothetical protein
MIKLMRLQNKTVRLRCQQKNSLKNRACSDGTFIEHECPLAHDGLGDLIGYTGPAARDRAGDHLAEVVASARSMLVLKADARNKRGKPIAASTAQSLVMTDERLISPSTRDAALLPSAASPGIL